MEFNWKNPISHVNNIIYPSDSLAAITNIEITHPAKWFSFQINSRTLNISNRKTYRTWISNRKNKHGLNKDSSRGASGDVNENIEKREG